MLNRAATQPVVMAEPSPYLQLTWEDPTTREAQQLSFTPPLAIGRELGQMPETLSGQSVSRLELRHPQVSRFHALITHSQQQLYIQNNSANGTFLNGRLLPGDRHPLFSHDTVRIGPYKITVTLLQGDEANSTELTHPALPRSLPVPPSSRQQLLVWFAGIGLLLLMGFSTWAIAHAILERSRPTVEPTSSRYTFGVAKLSARLIDRAELT